MIRHHFEMRETIATVIAEEQAFIDDACSAMIQARQELERYIFRDPFFRTTFEPYTPDSSDLTITRMAKAAARAGVGPMAAVAGTIAWAGVEAMVKSGAHFGIIDNGGDIALISDREVLIGIHAGTSPLSDRFAFIIPPKKGIYGICTSSATVGASISLGIADAVTVLSRDVALSDAWATAVCNEIRPGNTSVFSRLDPGEVDGVCAIIGTWTGTWGTIPHVVPAKVTKERITAGFGF
ncbi:MAG TPA: UPF0280 family protein [Methanoregulaceae archaeon]|nr:UPF0280 family protein [Methanoregulaceae archaeon]